MLPYSPLGGGVLTGKYRGGVPADSRAAAHGRSLADIATDRDVGIVEAVATAAEGLATSPIAVALAWVRDQPGVTAPIVGATKLGHLQDALAAEQLSLTAEDVRRLEELYVPHPVLGHI